MQKHRMSKRLPGIQVDQGLRDKFPQIRIAGRRHGNQVLFGQVFTHPVKDKFLFFIIMSTGNFLFRQLNPKGRPFRN